MEIDVQNPTLRDRALDILKTVYGFDAFRHPQEEIIMDVINGKDCLVLMPTGGGKSLCYQIPALVRNGVAVIVSPLIALMEDQVTALRLLGINAAYYNSSLDSEEARVVLQKLHSNTLDMLYIAPERLLSENFIARLSECEIALFAIDEAHCISQWGHDFRPEYSSLGCLKEQFPKIPIIALTATADQQTRRDITQQLHYNPVEYIASFNRPNLHYQVVPREKPLQQICNFIEDQPESSAGIIYCGTRSTVETLTEKLKDNGYSCGAYHAGLPNTERKKVQSLFRYDKINIVVATIAFGMGIDKPNVRYVIHYDLPKSIESYYQETGRAGRDGLPAKVLMLYDLADTGRLHAFIAANKNLSQQRIESAKLNHLVAYAEASHCRRQILLQYFDEEMKEDCRYCDVCDNPPKTIDATTEAQKFLSCIYRLNQSFGMNYIIEVLRGSRADKILKNKHDQLSTYGIGKDYSNNWWKHLGWQLIHRGYCYQDITQFNVLKLHKKAIPLLKGTEQIFLTNLGNTLNKRKSKTTVPQRQGNTDDPLFDKLRQLRRKIAEEENKPPFMIFSDAALLDMVLKKPKTLTEFLEVNGVGHHKMQHYGKQFIECLLKID